MDSHELAWAAGFFDGEGWVNRSGRGVQARIKQADSAGKPEVLAKFRRIVGVGRIDGPQVLAGKKDLYWWEATSRPDITEVAALIGPWLCDTKRHQFERTLDKPLAPIAWPGSMSEELAWAGGFFDGEGSTYLLKHRTHPCYLVPVIDVPQSGWDGVPLALTRLQAALSGLGHISGPHHFKWADAPVTRWRAGALGDLQLALHQLMPFIGTVKRAQARRVLMVVHSQPDLPRGNPAFGVAGARFCVRGHHKTAARLREYRSRGKDNPDRHVHQCLECTRDQARARRLLQRTLKRQVN